MAAPASFSALAAAAGDGADVTRAAADLLARCFQAQIARGVPRDAARGFLLRAAARVIAGDAGAHAQAGAAADCGAVGADTAEFEASRAAFDAAAQVGDAASRAAFGAGARVGDGASRAAFGAGAWVEADTARCGSLWSVFGAGAWVEADAARCGSLWSVFGAGARVEADAAERGLLAAVDELVRGGSRVAPELLGALYETSLRAGERRAGGVHFTPPAEVARVVGPTIVAPWSALLAAARTDAELRALHARLLRFRVLDPACGAGNFLLVALRELRRLETRLLAGIGGERPPAGVSAAQLHGMDVDPIAVAVARWSLAVVDGRGATGELRVMDAIVDADGGVPAWPRVDVIVGNPPFLDARKLTTTLGRAYARALRGAYPGVPGRADYCVYWLRRAHDALPAWSTEDPVAGRAGLVATKTIRENHARVGGLDHVVAAGGVIVEAVASQSWPGAASVDVAIVNWLKGDYRGPRVLQSADGERREVEQITSALTAGADVSAARPLAAVTRTKRCFEGQQPGHRGFRVDAATREALARADPRIDEVVFPYMIGEALLSGRHAAAPEFVIDFAARSLAEAAEHPGALAVVRRAVLPDWRANARREAADGGAGEHGRRVKQWWQLKRRRPELLAAIAGLPRYVVCVRHTLRPIVALLAGAIRPDSALTVFAFADDYSFGVLQSNIHWRWFAARCSSIGRRFRYTSETVFDAFPWPQRATQADVRAVAAAARAVRAVRAAHAGAGGLRALYRGLDGAPGRHPLRDAHAALDAAVMAAYGFADGEDVVAALLELGREVGDAADAVGPGLPPGVDPAGLVSADCVAAAVG
jgi:hypothetical protein